MFFAGFWELSAALPLFVRSHPSDKNKGVASVGHPFSRIGLVSRPVTGDRDVPQAFPILEELSFFLRCDPS